MSEPGYRNLYASGELARRAEAARLRLASCDLCARRCRVDRGRGPGPCRVGEGTWVSAFHPHFGEEAPLTGWQGSGTVFFAGCNLRCQYCQNHEISQQLSGREASAAELAAIMLDLQDQGCHNINLVSPSHVVAQILAALVIAAEAGLGVPLVYNTGGYDSAEALALLDGVVDIYMPDMKYSDATVARAYSRIAAYPAANRAAVREMHRQVGDLVLDRRGIAIRGLLVRHLVLPNNLAGTEAVVQFLAREVSANTYLNLMDQYRPCYRAHEYPALDRRPSAEEIRRALELAQAAGLNRLDPGSGPFPGG